MFSVCILCIPADLGAQFPKSLGESIPCYRLALPLRLVLTYCFQSRTKAKVCTGILVTVFDAILTSRQTREKLQCLYENLMSNNFRRTAVLRKI